MTGPDPQRAVMTPTERLARRGAKYLADLRQGKITPCRTEARLAAGTFQRIITELRKQAGE